MTDDIQQKPTFSSNGPLLLGLALVMIAALALILYATADTVEEGEILPYTTATAERVSTVLGFELTIQNEPPNRVDSLTAALLAAVGMIGMLLLLARPQADRRDQWFYGLLTLGAGFLAIDEILGVHETIGANMRFLGDLPGVNSPEDVVFGFYLLPALAFLIVFREKLMATRLSQWAIGLGLMLYIAAAILDVLDALLDEQFVETASIASLGIGFTAIALADLGSDVSKQSAKANS